MLNPLYDIFGRETDVHLDFSELDNPDLFWQISKHILQAMVKRRYPTKTKVYLLEYQYLPQHWLKMHPFTNHYCWIPMIHHAWSA